MPKDNLIGIAYGRLTVIAKAEGKSKWLCRCTCGKEKNVRSDALKKQITLSCGCYAIEKNTRHGHAYDPLYSVWRQIISRCTNQKDKGYKNYGGRGIHVCHRWLDSVSNFIEDMSPRPENSSIDRIDNNGPYSPGNCRWATRTMQANNRRSNRMLTLNGVTLTAVEWARKTGIKRETIKSRLVQGWSDVDTLTIAPRQGNYHGSTKLP